MAGEGRNQISNGAVTMGVRKSARRFIRKIWIDRLKHTYHFIHIPKNGGQSVRYALQLCGDVSMSTPFHHRYVDIVDTVGEDLKFFCIIRNPWSRTASRYMFGKQNAQAWPEDDPRRKYISSVSFDTFVRDQKVLPIPKHPGKPWMGPLSNWFNQIEWIRDKDGEVVCDCLRLENLSEELSAYLKPRINVPRRNVTQKSYDYRSMYTDDLADHVAELFRDDIEYFGFEFEGPATKNIAMLS